jgi:hypothetical protein
MEGTLCNPNDPAPAPPCNDPSLTLPVHEYDHADDKCSITGGYVWRGPVTPLTGLYFFGDYCTGQVWTLDPATLDVVERTAQLGAAGSSSFALVGFGEGGDGKLYLVLRSGPSNGAIYRLRSPDPACGDGVDNDGDGATDFPADPGCRDALSINEKPQCNDGADNDGDGPIDLADSGCGGVAWGTREQPLCGAGAELALLLLPLALMRARRSRRRAGTC